MFKSFQLFAIGTAFLLAVQMPAAAAVEGTDPVLGTKLKPVKKDSVTQEMEPSVDPDEGELYSAPIEYRANDADEGEAVLEQAQDEGRAPTKRTANKALKQNVIKKAESKTPGYDYLFNLVKSKFKRVLQ